jgi:hypothetical protein
MQARKSPGKTETLSLRLDPKTKFILEFASRINGQTITTIVERAIRASCDAIQIHSQEDFAPPLSWKDFWDPHEGIRTLKLFDSGYPSTYDEDELRDFVQAHTAFFYMRDGTANLNYSLVHILWPKIEEYRRIWRDKREKDYWAAGHAMAADLKAANVRPPPWPPETKDLPKAAPNRRGCMDDEIPF